MTTITLQDVSAWAGRESVYLYLVGLTKAAGRHLAFWIFFPVLLLMVLALAQAFPFTVRKALDRINKALPDVDNNAVLALVRDMYRLTYGAAKFYRPFCVFKSRMREIIEDLDESIDSLDFVLSNDEELREFAKACHSQRGPNLPLPFDERAVVAG